MNDRERIFESNIAQLLKRAYSPAPCRTEFRESLMTTILNRVEARRRFRKTFFPLMLAAAAVVIAAGGVIFYDRGVSDGVKNISDIAHQMVATPAGASHLITEKPAYAPRIELAAPPVTEVAPDTTSKSSTEPVAPGLMISGMIRDGETGLPVTRALVSALREDEEPPGSPPVHLQINDATGAFRFQQLRPGRYTIFVQTAGRAVERRTSVSSEQPQALEFTVRRGARIRGRVVRAGGGGPVAGALVLSETDAPLRYVEHMFDQPVPEAFAGAITAADGTFEIQNASLGVQVLRVSSKGLPPAWLDLGNITDPNPAPVEMIMNTSGGAVRGTVRDQAGNPVSGATIVAVLVDVTQRRSIYTFSEQMTNDRGEYQIAGLAPEVYTIVLVAPRAADGRRGVDVKPAVVRRGATIVVDFGGGSGKSRMFGNIQFGPGAAGAGLSLSMVPVGAADPNTAWRAATPAADGSYEFTDLEDGVWSVCIAGTYGATLTLIREITIPKNSDVREDFTIPPGLVEGSVRDSAGAGVARAVLLIERDGKFAGRAMTDATGRYQLYAVLPGTYQFHVYPVGRMLAHTSRTVDVPSSGAPQTVDFALETGGAIRATARLQSGEPAANAIITFYDPAGVEVPFGPPPTRTDERGVFTARGVRFGTWRVVVKVGAIEGEASVVVSEAVEKGAEVLLR